MGKYENNREIIRLIVAIAAIIYFGVGILMLYVGIKAEGSLDVSAGLFSGQLKTGDAGAIVIFLSFMLLLVSLVRVPSFSQIAFGLKNNRQRAVAFLVCLIVLAGVAILVATQTQTEGLRGAMYFLVGLLAFIFIITLEPIFNMLFADDNTRSKAKQDSDGR